MVRNYKRTTNQHKKLSVKAASKKYATPRTTLTRHFKNKVLAPGIKKLGNFQTVFSTEVENQLVNHGKEMQIRFFGLTK